ncbi:MAG: exonuclease domain-containing protein [Gemmatimonadota bacterium]
MSGGGTGPARQFQSDGGPAEPPEDGSAPDASTLLGGRFLVDASRRTERGIRIALAPVRAAPPLYAVRTERRPAGPEDRLRELEYAVVDVETTGTSATRGHRVTEVAAVRVRGDGTVLDEFTTLVNPERPIPPFITRLTCITSAMVAGAPRFAAVQGELGRVLDGAVFVAHNAGFDWRFVNAELTRAGAPQLRTRQLCTVRLARQVVPEIPRRSLDALAHFFGIANDARHRAYGDARATATVLERLLERCLEREVETWGALETLLARRAPRRPRRGRASPVSMRDAPMEIVHGEQHE